ncbi:MAG: hypothetical protein LBV30_06140 [Propionibacteriaceae bacterium]|nr:hypothetical protein [Propionibacteriaceae bacterium]
MATPTPGTENTQIAGTCADPPCRPATEEELGGVPNPGWSKGLDYDYDQPSPTGPSGVELAEAARNAEAFLEEFQSYGAADGPDGGLGRLDTYADVYPYVSDVVAADLDANAAEHEGSVPISVQEIIKEGKQNTLEVQDVYWADWSHKDYCIAAVRYIEAELPVGTNDWPPFVQPQWWYVKMTRDSGWRVDDWRVKAPAGWIAPQD